MSGNPYLDALDERYADIERTLDAVAEEATPAQRDAVKQEIVGFFRETEAALEHLGELKERIRKLVDRYKSIAAAAKPPVRAGGLAPARPVADHLNSSTHIERGWSAMAAGDYERAVKELQKALELAPNDPNAEGMLGWALMLQEQYDQALYSFHKVLMREPNNALARVNLGYICLKKQIFGEAIEHLSRAIRLDNDRKATLYATLYMGLVYLEREMYEDARSFFRKALDLGPNFTEAHWELGRAFYLEGKRDQALEAWRLGGETGRFNTWGERCIEAVRAVEAGEALSLV